VLFEAQYGLAGTPAGQVCRQLPIALPDADRLWRDRTGRLQMRQCSLAQRAGKFPPGRGQGARIAKIEIQAFARLSGEPADAAQRIQHDQTLPAAIQCLSCLRRAVSVAHMGADPGQHFGVLYRLDNIIHRAFGEAANHVAGIAKRGHENYRDIEGTLAGLHPPAGFKSDPDKLRRYLSV
jgi:hypothetical protein